MILSCIWTKNIKYNFYWYVHFWYVIRTKLSLRSNRIRSIEGLGKLSNLNYLNLSLNSISNINKLSNLSNIFSADLRNQSIILSEVSGSKTIEINNLIVGINEDIIFSIFNITIRLSSTT